MLRPLDEILGDFDATLPLEEASTIPGSWYTDPRVAEREKRTVFSRTWQVVGRAVQVESPGQYLTSQIGDEPIVVVRGTDGRLRAFFNVCRHHAAAVMTEPEGCAERLRCPYHGWTYSLEGERGRRRADGVRRFDRAKSGLVPVQVEVWEKFVFVCLADDTPSLAEELGEVVSRFEPLGLRGLHFAGRREYVLQCNWKVFVDNYLDGGYHVPYLHRGLNSILAFKDYTIENGARFCLQSSPIDGDAPGGEAMTASVRKGQALYYWLYPNFMLNWYEGYLDTNLVVPLAIDRTKVIFDFYFADVGESARERNEKSIAVSERIQDEDHAICESVQRGLGSRAYRAGRLSVRREAGENLFHRLLAGDLRRSFPRVQE